MESRLLLLAQQETCTLDVGKKGIAFIEGSSVPCVCVWISPSSEGAAPEQTLQVEQLRECEQRGPTKLMPIFTGARTLSGQAGLGHGDPKKCVSQTMKTWKSLSWQCKFYERKYLSNW